MLAWLRAGTELAERFAGFLGSGWVRPDEGSSEWHMLYRFASPDAPEAWELSAQRRWWLDSAQGFVAEASREHRTGIEGWFDEPTTGSITIPRADGTTTTVAMVQTPPRWKQAVSIWLGFFPVNLAFTYAMSPVPGWDGIPIWLRVLATTLVLTPIMTYWVLPRVTRMLRGWLAR